MTTAAEYREITGALLDELKENGIQFQIKASAPTDQGLVLKLEFPTLGSANDAEELLKEYLAANVPEGLKEVKVDGSTMRVVVTETVGSIPQKPAPIPFSSPDESKAEEPKDIAIKLVRQQLEDESKTAESVYVVWFAFVLGHWKALVSTSLPDGRYYEVTHNSNKDETYVDTYEKIRNEVHSDESLTK